MRESRTYGSGRGACDEMHVPTATSPRHHHAAWRSGGLAARGAAACALLDRGWGKPTQPIAGDDGHDPVRLRGIAWLDPAASASCE